MSAKGKSSIRAEPGSVNVDGDIESDASGCESVTVLNTKKRPLPTTTITQVIPTTAAKMRESRAKGKPPAKKLMKTDTTTEPGVLFPSLALDFPDSEEKMMDQPILIGSDIGECGGTFSNLFYYII